MLLHRRLDMIQTTMKTSSFDFYQSLQSNPINKLEMPPDREQTVRFEKTKIQNTFQSLWH